MNKVLITYATRPLGLRVAKLLMPKLEVIKATSDEVPSVLQSQYFSIPEGSKFSYVHEVLKLALDMQCTYILPLGIDEVYALSETAVLLEEYGIHVLCPQREVLDELSYVQNPGGDVKLTLLSQQIDVLSGEIFEDICIDGLFMVSDSGSDVVLIVV